MFSSSGPGTGTEGARMKIAIIGAGNVGKALAKSSIKGRARGHPQRRTESAAEAATATGARAARSNVEAVEGAGWKLVGPPND